METLLMDVFFEVIGILTCAIAALVVAHVVGLLAWDALLAGYQVLRLEAVRRRCNPVTFVRGSFWRVWWWTLTMPGVVTVGGIIVPREPWRPLGHDHRWG